MPQVLGSRVGSALATLGRADPRWLWLAAIAFAVATALAAAIGFHRPLVAALLIIPALDVSGLLPLTPENIGIASAAIAIAFQAHGVSFNRGLAAGITLQALETAVGLTIGIASVLWLAPHPRPARRIALAGAVVASALGAAVLVPLV